MAFIYADKDHRGDPKIQLVEGRYEVVSANFASFKRQRAAEELCNRLNSPFKGEAQAMSDQDKQFVDAVSRWRSADEKDARIAALEAECERLRDDLEVMTADRDGCARQRDQLRAELWTGAWTLPPEAPDVSGLVEALEYCEKWFARHQPTAPLIGGFGDTKHPMLTRIRAALAAHKAGGVE